MRVRARKSGRGGSGKYDRKSPGWRLTSSVRGRCANTQHRNRSWRKLSWKEKVTSPGSTLPLSSTFDCTIPFWIISSSSRRVHDYPFNTVSPAWTCVGQGYASSCDFFSLDHTSQFPKFPEERVLMPRRPGFNQHLNCMPGSVLICAGMTLSRGMNISKEGPRQASKCRAGHKRREYWKRPYWFPVETCFWQGWEGKKVCARKEAWKEQRLKDRASWNKTLEQVRTAKLV